MAAPASTKALKKNGDVINFQSVIGSLIQISQNKNVHGDHFLDFKSCSRPSIAPDKVNSVTLD